MKIYLLKRTLKHCFSFVGLIFFVQIAVSQTVIKGKVINAGGNGDPLYDATVVLKGTTTGVKTDFDGTFELNLTQKPPFTLSVSYIGYTPIDVPVAADTKLPLSIKLAEETKTLDVVIIKAPPVSEKTQKSALTVETLEGRGIKEIAAPSLYQALSNAKGVDMTTASIGYTIINTRGFNSTSPVRSLQIIDGVDNQAPGLNFSLGNFLGSSELDVQKVDLVVGASSAYFGPNAFNGVISMETKNPFYNRGLAGSVKGGERGLLEASFRFAESYKNKEGHAWFAFKLNGFFLKAHDWEADNYDPVYNTDEGKNNPGRYDAVNIYGDEYNATFDQRSRVTKTPIVNVGLNTYHRTGYQEKDIVDYDTRNIKANAAFHFRLRPSQAEQSPELIVSSNFGNGTTVYQGDNRFSLKDILFLQNRLEIRKRDKYFIRAYKTQEDAGNSYDPYFTALVMQQRLRDNTRWAGDYEKYWADYANRQVVNLGYPQLKISIGPNGEITRSFDTLGALAWLANPRFIDSMTVWHKSAEYIANGGESSKYFLRPGTAEFQAEFNKITSTVSNKRDYNDPTVGTRFYDKSALYHVQGEYRFQPKFTDEIVVGGNVRMYRPLTNGSIFSDTAGVPRITNNEIGSFVGIEKKFGERIALPDNTKGNKKFKFNATLRVDKNQNFNVLFSPAVSLVWQPNTKDFVRFSFSSAIRNPTLSDQYLFLNVGRAILSGNLSGAKNLITVESFKDYLSTLNKDTIRRFDIAPVQPEKVKSFEVGYRTTLWDNTFVDASYYFSIYDRFIGYQVGVTADLSLGIPRSTQAYRYSANSLNTVTTQGFSIGVTHYLKKGYQVSGNYSWNVLNTKIDDPIIPAFNTPDHKFNVGILGRDLEFGKIKNVGFALNYKWIHGFLYEGSPQFTGLIPTYDLLDGQISYNMTKLNTILKIGGSNLLNKKQFQSYGGPRIGRMAYISLLYDFVKK